MSKKLTRREMVQKDEFVTFVEKLAMALERHGRSLAMGAGAVVVLILVVGLALSYLRSRGEAADAQFGQALLVLQSPVQEDDQAEPVPGSYPTAAARDQAALEELDRLLEDHPYSKAASAASFLRATVLLRLQRPDEARQALLDFAETYPESELVPRSKRTLAKAEMLAGDPAAGIAILQELVENPTTLVPVDTALMDLGRMQEAAGDFEAAAETYRRLADEHPQSTYAGEATQAFARLVAAGAVSS